MVLDKLIRLAGNAQTSSRELTRAMNNTSLSSTVKIDLTIDEPKLRYTSGDIISGEVVVELTKEIDLSEITLKYKVDEATELLQPESGHNISPVSSAEKTDDERKYQRRVRRREEKLERKRRRARDHRRNEEVSFKGAARVYEKGVRLFPSAKQSAALQMKKLTLPPGTHRYPFSVRIPGHENDNFKALPPSFTDANNTASVSHTLKATLRRASNFKQNSRHETPLNFIPSVDARALDHRSYSVQHEIRTESKSFFSGSSTVGQAMVDLPSVIQTDSRAQLRVGASDLSGRPLAVHNVNAELIANVNIRAQSRQENRSKSEQFLLSRDNENNCSFMVPSDLIPSFSTKFISLKYKLRVTLQVASTKRPGQAHTAVLSHDLRIVGTNVFPEQSHSRAQQHEANYSYGSGSASVYPEDTKEDHYPQDIKVSPYDSFKPPAGPPKTSPFGPTNADASYHQYQASTYQAGTSMSGSSTYPNATSGTRPNRAEYLHEKTQANEDNLPPPYE